MREAAPRHPTDPSADEGPDFTDDFRARLGELMAWRRDVRRFLSTPLPDGLIDNLIAQACLAPSVGNSQPWRIVHVDDPARRAAVKADFEACNAHALGGYEGERAALYSSLKLSGFDKAPAQLAVFSDETTVRGQGLGRQTMPEMLAYSVVGWVNTFWLAARAAGIGVGWVSILDPDKVTQILDVPVEWKLIGYLCVGYPEEEHLDPELDRHGWEKRGDPGEFVFKR